LDLTLNTSIRRFILIKYSAKHDHDSDKLMMKGDFFLLIKIDIKSSFKWI